MLAVTVGKYDLRTLRIAGWFLAAALASLSLLAAINQHSMNPDGIAYLDIGDAYLRGDWQTAINPVWSPLYSWILGLVMWALDPPMRWEFPVVHLVNFLIYMVALVCFDFFWRQVIRYHRAATTGPASTPPNALVAIPDWAWLALGYALFIWTSLSLIAIWAVTPDMLMSALVYLAAGLVLRIRLGLATRRTFVFLGVALGLGYLTKAVMFPLALVFLAVALFSAADVRRGAPLTLLSLATFLLVSSPFVALISDAKGRFTFGEAGTNTYVRHVNGIPSPHWQGEPPGYGIPEHPTRKILDTPPIFEFGTPIGGTYPVSHDPSYWYEGASPRLDPGAQARTWLSSALFYVDLLFHQLGGWTAGVLVLYLMSDWRQVRPGDVVRRWGLAIIALTAFAMYASVYVEARYLGAFLPLLWGDLLANVRLPDSLASRKLVAIVSAIAVLFMVLNMAAFNLKGLSSLTAGASQIESSIEAARPPEWPGAVAEELHRLGVGPGEKVAVIGYAFDSYWARLARVQIVAEMLEWEADPFWIGDASLQAAVLDAFASTGAEAVVAERVPGYASLPGWHQVNDTNFYVYVLDR